MQNLKNTRFSRFCTSLHLTSGMHSHQCITKLDLGLRSLNIKGFPLFFLSGILVDYLSGAVENARKPGFGNKYFSMIPSLEKYVQGSLPFVLIKVFLHGYR